MQYTPQNQKMMRKRLLLSGGVCESLCHLAFKREGGLSWKDRVGKAHLTHVPRSWIQRTDSIIPSILQEREPNPARGQSRGLLRANSALWECRVWGETGFSFYTDHDKTSIELPWVEQGGKTKILACCLQTEACCVCPLPKENRRARATWAFGEPFWLCVHCIQLILGTSRNNSEFFFRFPNQTRMRSTIIQTRWRGC